jgi:hypothetical protein
MPKKKTTETQEAQSERFREEVARLVAAGELNPIEADEKFEQLTRSGGLKRPPNLP